METNMYLRYYLEFNGHELHLTTCNGGGAAPWLTHVRIYIKSNIKHCLHHMNCFLLGNSVFVIARVPWQWVLTVFKINCIGLPACHEWLVHVNPLATTHQWHPVLTSGTLGHHML